MQLKEGKTYQITELEHVFKITLIRLPTKGVPFYQWQNEEGNTIGNRQQDVERWSKRGLIKEITT